MRIACRSAVRATGSPMRLVRRPNHAPGQHQAPGRRVHEQRFAVAEMIFPVAGRNLVGDEPVRCFRVRNAQQRFRQAHEDDTLTRAEVILAQERIEPAAARLRAAHGVHQRERPTLHRFATLGRQPRQIRETSYYFSFRSEIPLVGCLADCSVERGAVCHNEMGSHMARSL
jgi:hypothetical protein